MHTDNTVCSSSPIHLCSPYATLQTAENKNRFAIQFLAYSIRAGWFEQVFWHFPLERHGGNELDQMFRVIKSHISNKIVSSVPALQEKIDEGTSKIKLRELTCILDTHAMTDHAVFPSGLQDFHFWHLYPSKEGVHLRARLFLAKSVNEPADTLPFTGTATGKALLLLPVASQLPDFVYSAATLSEATQATIQEILATDTLTPALRDKRWWRTLGARCSVAPNYSWEAPTGVPFVSSLPSEEGIAEVVQAMNLKLHHVQKITSLPIAHFYASANSQQQLSRLSVAELQRRGLGFAAPPSAELTAPGADVDRINREAEELEEEESLRRKRRHVIVRLSMLALLSIDVFLLL